MQACSSHAVKHPARANLPAPVILAEGRAAVINGSIALAKKQALQAAVRQAGLQSGALSQAQVLEEKTLGSTVKVRAKVTLNNGGLCVTQNRKRILATAFPLAETGQVAAAESNDLFSGIPREISNALMASQEFINLDATQISLYDQPQTAPTLPADNPYQPSSVMQLAKVHGAQLVLSGVVRDLQIDSGDYIRGSGPEGMVKSWMHDVWSKRTIGLDVYVHDGFTGALLFQRRYQDVAMGNVWLPDNYAVGSFGFKSTQTGAKIAGLIERASADVRQSQSCSPFATRIIKIDGNKLFVDAGAQERLKAGDQLVVYADASSDLGLEGGSRYVAYDKQPVGVITLHDIQTRYAMGYLDVLPAKAGVKVGDWVKSW